MRAVNCVVLALTFLASNTATANDKASLPFVSPIFGDNMVLQRGKPNTLWGWSRPGDPVRVEIAGRASQTITGPDGRWRLQIEPPAPGGPYTVRIDGARHVVLREVLIGDVWLCGGQSNMQFALSRARNGADEIKAANHPEIRLFSVEQCVAYFPAAVPQGAWKICSPRTVADFSAVAYFFARRLQEDVPVPIGLISDCLGGSPAESWMGPESLSGLKDFKAALAEIERLKAQGGPEHGSFLMHWLDQYDIGLKDGTWAAPDLDDSQWKNVRIPGGIRELGVADIPSVSWFRKEITLPDPLPAGKAVLFLGSIDKMDTAYINGQRIWGSSWVEHPRAYPIREDVLKPGKNLIALRVFKMTKGGFLAKPEELRLAIGDATVIPLAGEWKGRVSVDARPPHPLPLDVENYPTMPIVLHQGMIAPVAPFALTGAIWYQGEANFTRAYQYRTLLPALIEDWRRLFGQGEFPFYIVSLPAFMQRKNEPSDDAWAELREAQALTARHVPNTALAVTVDTGDADDIHPKDKKVVGERLALCALARHYGKAVPYQGPIFRSFQRLPGALKLYFDHADGGLVAKGDKPGEFMIAGKDRKWRWAEARIEGDAVVVSSAMVPDPLAARYAWQANPQATLFNGAGLPAIPFRTDDWPLSTEAREP
jgi:sialate O-acetylesterase